MSEIKYSNIADPHLIEAINHVAESIGKVAEAINIRTDLMFPVVKNCGTCRFFDRKNLIDGICFANGKEHAERRRVAEKPCEKHEERFL